MLLDFEPFRSSLPPQPLTREIPTAYYLFDSGSHPIPVSQVSMHYSMDRFGSLDLARKYRSKATEASTFGDPKTLQ